MQGSWPLEPTHFFEQVRRKSERIISLEGLKGGQKWQTSNICILVLARKELCSEDHYKLGSIYHLNKPGLVGGCSFTPFENIYYAYRQTGSFLHI